MEQREKDIQNLCKQVLEAIPNTHYTGNSDYTLCPFCGVIVHYEEEDIGKLKHSTDCAYLIAKDLRTGF